MKMAANSTSVIVMIVEKIRRLDIRNGNHFYSGKVIEQGAPDVVKHMTIGGNLDNSDELGQQLGVVAQRAFVLLTNMVISPNGLKSTKKTKVNIIC